MARDIITLYHGSMEVVQPVHGMGKSYNDFGCGFYCTQNKALAGEWACSHGTDGFINVYTAYLTDLSVLDLCGGGFNILNWLAILLENRTFNLSEGVGRNVRDFIVENFLPDYMSYDLIIGYRADDSYFSFVSDFLNNSIPLSVLKRAMSLGKLGEQVVLKSEKAFDSVHFELAEEASANEYFALYASRDKAARKKYAEIKHADISGDDYFAMDILRGNWKNGDPRL